MLNPSQIDINKRSPVDSSNLCNPDEYYASGVAKSEQISFKSREGQLFQKFLNALDPSTLESVDFRVGKVTRDHIPKESGVYFVFVNDKLVYIGQTRSIAQRLRSHHLFLTPLKKTQDFTVRWLLLPRDRRLKAETYLIRRFGL